MASPEDVLALCAYVHDVAQRAVLVDVPPGHEGLRARILALAEHALTEADAPLRIGVVGDFSAGKSLLLGVLAGRPDLLPTSAEPTTGNITELRFLQDDADGPGRTGVEAARVRFLDAEGLEGLRRTLVGALEEVVKSGFADALAERLSSAAASGPDAVTAWCRTAWPLEDQTLRALIREWMLTGEAADAAGALLGREFPIAVSLLPTALQLAHPPLPTAFPEPAGHREPIAPGPDGTLGATGLTRGFPLIERVSLDLRVPTSVWDLSALRGRNQFALLDFPGIGGTPARARDRFLAVHGLADVETILVLVDAQRPGGPAPDAFYRSLRALGRSDEVLADSMLYCAGGFDRLLPPPATPGESRMTVDRLTSLHRPLRVLLQSGHQPGVSAVQAFVSSVLALCLDPRLAPVPAEVGLEIRGPSATASAAGWREVAGALAADGTGAQLTGALTAYTQDGGISRLRALLEDHVRKHGLALRLNRLAELVDELDAAKEELVGELEASGGVDRSESAERAQQVRRLFTEVNSRRIRLVDWILPTLRDPGTVPFGRAGTLREHLARRAAELVVAWPQWAAIFECVEDDVIVAPRRAAAAPAPTAAPARRRISLVDEVFPDQVPASAQTRLPQSVAEFVEPFVASCQALRQFSADALGPSLSRWLAARSAESADLRRRADLLLDAGARGRVAADPTLAHVESALSLLLDPARITERALTALRAGAEQDAADATAQADDACAQRARDAFPLRGDQIPGWATDPPAGPGARHVVRALRMRSALIEKITEIGLEDLSLLLEDVYQMLDELFTAPGMRPSLDQIDAFVAAVRGDAPQAGPSDAAEALASAARPPLTGTPPR